jgi:hypothetical protein
MVSLNDGEGDKMPDIDALVRVWTSVWFVFGAPDDLLICRTEYLHTALNTWYSLFERHSLDAYARLTKSCKVLLLRLVSYFLKGLHEQRERRIRTQPHFPIHKVQ